MTEQTTDIGGMPGLMDRLLEWVPARLRRARAVVPVVRLSGVIGAVTPLRPGMSLAGVAGCWSALLPPRMPRRWRW
jgi:cobalamin biosynthesis protein CobD/CbiB